MQIQISWLLQKPTDLDLHCLQRQGLSGSSRTRIKLDSQHAICSIRNNITISENVTMSEHSQQLQYYSTCASDLKIEILSSRLLLINLSYFSAEQLKTKTKSALLSALLVCKSGFQYFRFKVFLLFDMVLVSHLANIPLHLLRKVINLYS